MPKKPTEQPPAMTRDEIEQLIVAVVKRELANLVANLEARAMAKHKGTGPGVTKRTVSVPSDLWALFRRECPGPASQHITAAIRVYLATRKTGQM